MWQGWVVATELVSNLLHMHKMNPQCTALAATTQPQDPAELLDKFAVLCEVTLC